MKEITAKPRAGLTYRETVNVARKRVHPCLYLIKRHGLWFRPEANGYTSNLSEAGVFGTDDARDYLCVEGLSVVPLDSLRKRIEMEMNSLDRERMGLEALLEKAIATKPGDGE